MEDSDAYTVTFPCRELQFIKWEERLEVIDGIRYDIHVKEVAQGSGVLHSLQTGDKLWSINCCGVSGAIARLAEFLKMEDNITLSLRRYS